MRVRTAMGSVWRGEGIQVDGVWRFVKDEAVRIKRRKGRKGITW